MTAFVYGFAAPGMLENSPVTAGADSKVKLALVQLNTS